MIVLATSILSVLACKEGKSPTEPAAIVATPTPTPVPQPASMSGFFRHASGLPVEDASVGCQMKEARVAADGSYVLTELYSGRWDVHLCWAACNGESSGAVILSPGANTVDFTIP